ncbi:MAG: methyl-accepting chemotaxis protein [Rhodocyclaceae bacterium]|nr:methyl-accepting chemotaxis protein [Rhodocyclaceae bacterium]
MAFTFKLPSLNLPGQTLRESGGAPAAGGDKVEKQKIQLSLQLKFFGALFIGAVVAIGLVSYVNSKATLADETRASLGHQINIEAYQLGRAVPLALGGQNNAFTDMRAVYDDFESSLNIIAKGGEYKGVRLSPSSGDITVAANAVLQEWTKVEARISAMLVQQGAFTALATFVAEGTQAKMWNSPIGERMVRIASQLASAQPLDKATTTALAKDLRMQLEFVVSKGESGDLGTSAVALLAALPAEAEALATARDNGIALLTRLQPLSNSTDALLSAFGSLEEQGAMYTALFAIFGSLVLTSLVVVVKIFNEEAAERNAESETLRMQAETERNASQDAILRLMNEMGDLADGDLTIRATVTEDITGAIADSVNYTIEELSVLVKRINDAATRVAAASETAQKTTDELLSATETQSQEIRTANTSVLSMAESMTNVSANASESARVALVSLAAAQKGSAAVTNSIKGMNEIRQQIQETSKRIKRLGESSQEIGEIVELISDITEQTNVLALNAAIQAASAGEAGRGFTVVAEEVQRLAERSAEATKQIAAIVKTIQTDTHDAVSAMENSTQNVVEGAQLSDAAGQALEEISKVSQNLADLIESISGDTEKQASVATEVAKLMQNILHITEQTTTGTRQTAVSIGELAELASELKGSVAGFKV